MSTTALHAMRRAHHGERVECTRWNHGTLHAAMRELVEPGWMSVRVTPKGTKRYLELTEQGKGLMPEIERYYKDQAEEQKRVMELNDLMERRQRAGPELWRALERIADQTHDENTRRYAHEVLAKLA